MNVEDCIQIKELQSVGTKGMKKRIAQEEKKEDKEEVSSYNEKKKHNVKI